MADDQEARLKAFRDHDFPADPEWQTYLSRVEIPSNSEADVLKVKAKWWKRTKDPDFDVALAVPAQPPPAPAPQPPQPPRAAPRPAPQPAPQAARAAGAGGAGVPGVPEWAPFAADVGIIVLSVLYLLPLVPLLSSGHAYRLVLLLCFASHLMQLFKLHGVPRSMSALQQWAVSALPSTPFSYAMTALMFLTGPAITAVLPPFVILAAYSAAAHAAAHYHGHPLWASQGARLHAALLRNRQRAMHLAAQLEVTLGFWMVLMLLVPSRRSFILTFFVWQQLRLRYWSPDAGAYHRAAWLGIGQAAAPLRAALPALETPIAFGIRWFQSAHPGMRQQAAR